VARLAVRTGVRARPGWLVALLVLATLGASLAALPGKAEAAPTRAVAPTAASYTGANFDPGYIIDDVLFYDRFAMSAAEIQAFLDSKIGTCTNGKCLNVAVVPFESRPARISPDTGRLVCEAVQGGNLRVSELIYRVQVACSISAKVILATLHKEQGLVTKTAPSDWALSHAMGWACPDSTGCNAAFAGLGIQIYMGTRQLMTYKAGSFARQPGTHNILYHPNTACGSKSVNVRNYATAALYNYTPYVPNAAALANLGRTGDSCSSYGNRNFWDYYYSWFGSPTPISALGVEVDRLGGQDRIGTALEVSRAYFDETTDVVYVANALDFPDSLSAGPAAAAEGAPLLLVMAPGLRSDVRDEIVRLSPSRIVVVGGSAAVSDQILAQLEELAPTERLEGSDRYSTSRAMAVDAFGPSAPLVYIASGVGFADALSASSVAAIKGAPILLLRGNATDLDQDTRDVLADLGTTDIVIVGGIGVVRPEIETQLGELPGVTSVTRYGGGDRYATSLQLVMASFDTAPTVFLASGETFPDALAGGAAGGKINAPLLLVGSTCVPRPTVQGVIDLETELAVVLGGSGAVSNAVQFWKNC
jgi:putative cell wall-binding protein